MDAQAILEVQIKISAINAEIEGMKTANAQNKIRNEYPDYGRCDFERKAQELRELLK